MGTLYKGRGSADMRDDYLDFINYVFGYNGTKEDFIRLLPKLYKEEYHPCENNYVVTDDGKLKSAVGIFPRRIEVMGEVLSAHGVGNVAVHPYARSKGYMRELMTMAVQDMIRNGADFSDLGGLRQRYGYFSYENASPEYQFELSGTNMRHCFDGKPLRPLVLRKIESADDPLLEEIFELYEKRPCRALRPREQFFDILCSWNDRPFAVLDGENFLGYFIGSLNELTLCDNGDFEDVLRNYIAQRGALTLRLPIDSPFVPLAEPLCENVRFVNAEKYTVFNYERVIRAFLRLKARAFTLADGELCARVNGFARTETLLIRVKDGVPTVEAAGEDRDAALTLEHRAAMSFFFGAVCPLRDRVPLTQNWFPLPLYMDRADHV